MLVIGLTGSIGMGKSTAAAHLRELGIAVFDADAAVHDLYSGAAVPLIEDAFPGTTQGGIVDRAKLLMALVASPDGFRRLEAMIHPLVRDMEREFLRTQFASGAAMAVLEIPLLFETGGDRLCDLSIVLSASPEEQRQRVLARPGMTPQKLEEILSRQMPDADKRARADFVVDTGGAISETQVQIDRIIAALKTRPATAYHRHWAPA
ncbi:MAG: dephospho-CoA kinase [Hyphomicrobiaceae bacterium]|nr:dephospho-CoA kinase [Hyphomicrobiaceae bacterium]MCC0007406.1 dephospho-CoA kinase [Hyphomicrobiaceae bacterium]